MLDSHPELAIPPETHFIPDLIDAAKSPEATPGTLADVAAGQRHWVDFGIERDDLAERFASLENLTAKAALRSFYGLCAERRGKPRWGEKTPRYVLHMKQIGRVLPEARFIHLIRDGRDVRLSRITRVDPPPSPTLSAQRWQRRIVKARRQAQNLDSYLEIRFEDLVLDPEPTLRQVCKFCELEWDPVMLDYHRDAEDRLSYLKTELPGGEVRPGTRMSRKASNMRPPDPSMIGRWKSAMSAEDIAEYEAKAGDLLAELGYELSNPRG